MLNLQYTKIANAAHTNNIYSTYNIWNNNRFQNIFNSGRLSSECQTLPHKNAKCRFYVGINLMVISNYC